MYVSWYKTRQIWEQAPEKFRTSSGQVLFSNLSGVVQKSNLSASCPPLHRISWVLYFLFDAIAKDDAFFPKGAKGNQIRKVVKIMDGPINKLLQSAVATVELELWRVHAEHISKVCGNGGKRQGCQSYHSMLMNWAIAFLSHSSASTYNKVAKIMMHPNISTVYQKMAEMIYYKK